MKVIMEFDCQTMKAKVKFIKEEKDDMTIFDALPYCVDELYDELYREAKQEGLR